MGELKQCFQASLRPCTWSNRIKDSKTLVQLIVDCRKLVPDILLDNTELLNTIKVKTKLLCYELLLNNINKEIYSVGMVADPHFSSPKTTTTVIIITCAFRQAEYTQKRKKERKKRSYSTRESTYAPCKLCQRGLRKFSPLCQISYIFVQISALCLSI